MVDKYNDFIEDHGGILLIIWLCGLVGLLGYSLMYEDATSFLDIIGAAVWTFGFWIIVFLILPMCLRICEMLFLNKKSRKAENTIDDSAEDSFSALDISYSESCTVGMSVAETIRKNTKNTFVDLLKQYTQKTDNKDAKKIKKLLDVMEENHIAVSGTLERQQFPLLKESLESYLSTPDEVSEHVVHEMEKNIDQMLYKVLQQLQDAFDVYYENKSQDIEINRNVVEQLSPEDPFDNRKFGKIQ